MRFLLNHHARRIVTTKSTTKTKKSVEGSASALKTNSVACNNPFNTNHSLAKSWGQQCSPKCGCVLRFEAKTDENQLILNCNYVAMTVVTTIDKKNGGRLIPVYTTRMSRPMFQECKCTSLHSLAKHVMCYLPNKRWDLIRAMNNFTFTRSSLAFRHAVLSEHGLPRTDAHCFDIVEEAFTALFNGEIPSKRRVDAPFERIILTNCIKGTPEVQFYRTKSNDVKGSTRIPHQCAKIIKNSRGVDHRVLGIDRNGICTSTPKTMAKLGMLDINAEIWSDEDEFDVGETTIDSKNSQFDWVSFVDEQHTVDDFC